MSTIHQRDSEIAAISPTSSSPLWQGAALLLLGCLGIAIYSNSFHAPLVFDGEIHIHRNPAVREVWPWLTSWRADHADGGNRPIGFLTFAINYACGGYDLPGFHAVNLFIHVAAAWLLFDVVRRTLVGRQRSPNAVGAWYLALGIALVWLAHPLQTNSVTYVYQRLEALMALFYLATLWCFVRGLTSLRRGWWFAASVACCGLGMATKEVMVTAPLVVLWYDRVFAARSWRELFSKRGKYYAALAATWGILAWLMLTNGDEYSASGVLVVEGMSPLRYARSQPGVILHYLRLAFWPDQLCLDYGWPVASHASQIVPQALVLGALLALTIWAIFRCPGCGFLGGCFFLILAPTSSVAPLADLAFEHRMYLPLAALAALVILGGEAAWRGILRHGGGESLGNRYLRWGLPAAAVATVVAVFGISYIARNRDYRTDLSIWSDTVQKCPVNARAHHGLGAALFERGDRAGALTEFRQAVALDPRYPAAVFSLGIMAAKDGNHRQAIQDFSRVVDLMRDFPRVYAERGRSFAQLGQHERAVADFTNAIHQFSKEAEPYRLRGTAYAMLGKQKEALKDLTQADKLEPNNARTLYGRGIAFQQIGKPMDALADFDRAIALAPRFAPAYSSRGELLARMREYDKSIADYTRLIEFNPRDIGAYNSRGNLYVLTGKAALAEADYGRVIELKPDFAAAYYNRAVVRVALRRYQQAIADCSEALRLDPNYANALGQRARIRATSPDTELRDGAQAVIDATRACELTQWRNAVYLDTLAAGYAEKGDFPAAIEWQTKAIALMPADELSRRSANERLKLYQANKPCREPPEK